MKGRFANQYFRFLIMGMIFAFGKTAFAQPNIAWTRGYSFDGYSDCRSIRETDDQGFIVAGMVYTEASPLISNLCILKIAATGDSLWSRILDLGAAEFGMDAFQANDGGFFLTGYRVDQSTQASQICIVKLNALGDSIWSRTLESENSQLCSSVLETSDGGMLVCGTEMVNDEGNILVIRIGESGDSLWSRAFDLGQFEECLLAIPREEGYLLLGTSSAGEGLISSMCVIAVNEDGDSLWSRIFSGPNSVALGYGIQTSDGGYLLVGTHAWTNFGIDLVKTDDEGNIEWDNILEQSRYVVPSFLKETSEGFVISGFIDNSESGNDYDYWLMKTDSNGDSVLERVFSSWGLDFATAGTQSSDGGYLISGSKNTWEIPFGQKFWIVKTDLETMSSSDSRLLLPEFFQVLSAYPNPFNPRTTISFSIPVAGLVNVSVFDIQGREVAELANQTYPAGEHEIVFDGSGNSSGFYFVKLQTPQEAKTVNLVLMK